MFSDISSNITALWSESSGVEITLIFCQDWDLIVLFSIK